jgi:DNA-binding IclR family transcriptional regulator
MLPRSAGLRHALRIVRALAESRDGVGFARLRHELGLPAATCSRLLKVLADEGWVAGGSNEPWRCGPTFEHVVALRSARDVGALLQSEVEALADETQESAAFVTWAGDGFVFRAKCEKPDSYHYLPLLAKNPAYGTHAFGQLCAAYEKPEALPKAVSAARIREMGFHHGEDRGIRVVGAVFAGGVFAGAIGVSLLPRPLSQAALERYTRAVRRTAARATARLSSAAPASQSGGAARAEVARFQGGRP